MTDLITRHAAERPEPDPPPAPPPPSDPLPPGDPRPVDPPSVFPGGVELTRLLALAQLTVAQAVELAAAVASELVRRSGPDADPPGGPVHVGADGRVVPGRAASGGSSRAAASDVAALLAGIADAVRSRAGAAGAAAEQLLAGLDRAVVDLPDAGLPAVARELREVATAIDRRTVRAELGALVRAIGADEGAVRAARPVGARPSPPRAAAAGRTATGRRRGTTRRRIGAWLLSVLVLAGVVVLEVAFLRDHIVADIGLLLDAGRGGSAPSASAARAPDGPPVAAPAPASAGRVTGVDLRALSSCTPGAPCGVRLEVRLTPGIGPQAVTWTFRIVDRCIGSSATATGGSVTLPPGAQRAAAVATVALPATPGVALIAVTGKPAAAASAPVVIGSCTTHR